MIVEQKTVKAVPGNRFLDLLRPAAQSDQIALAAAVLPKRTEHPEHVGRLRRRSEKADPKPPFHRDHPLPRRRRTAGGIRREA